jgi:DNA-directed RNA polymerase subunit K/omega
MNDHAGKAERYESARRDARTAHEAAGDAEDALTDAERDRDASTSPAQRELAQEHVDQAEGTWRLRLTEADLATERRDRARDAFETEGDGAGGSAGR